MAPRLFELLKADEPQWVDILEEACVVKAARYIHPSTNLTPLHLAVTAKDAKTQNNNNDARVAVIQSLLQSNLQCTEVQCTELGYTPLMYACIVKNLEHLEHDAKVVKLLLGHNEECFRIRSKAGQSALDIHIMSSSSLQQQNNSRRVPNSKRDPSCTTVLKALMEYDLGISLPRSLDLLLACNSLQVLERVAQEEALSFAGRLRDRRKQRKSKETLPVPAASQNVKNCWVWEFFLEILKAEHQHTFRGIRPVPPFNALHTASQVKDFPLPFMILCMRAYPAQLRTPTIGQSEWPIHSVAGWEASDSMAARKCMTITELIHEHPTPCKYRNRHGKTPLSLALETGTAWDNGVRRLTAAQKEDSFVRRQTPGVME